jgi:hypothetical protein
MIWPLTLATVGVAWAATISALARLHAAANLHHRGWIIARLRPRFNRNHGTAVLLSASVELQSQYIQSRP